MFIIIGMIVVFGAVIGGYLMEHGNLMVLVQPAELVIIVGPRLGTVLIANPLHIIKKIVGGVMGALKAPSIVSSGISKPEDVYEMFNQARARNGLVALETDIEDPTKSQYSPSTNLSRRTTTRAISCATRCAWRSPAV